MRLSLSALLAAAQAAASASLPPRAPTVQIRNGTVVGKRLPGFEQDAFLGIPFARAPRLDNPLPPRAFGQPLDATQYGPACYGFFSNVGQNFSQSEECLYLNVVRPSSEGGGGYGPSARLPVMFWMYGGGFQAGGSQDPKWNLSYTVQQSVRQGQPLVAVSINYRLSFLGFPAGRQVQDAGASNLGLKDQRAALRWLQENIAAFGGDPTKVTIRGESAGSLSVNLQALAYGGSGGAQLFRAMIGQSGPLPNQDNLLPTAAKQAGFDQVAANAGCAGAADPLACLRAAPLDRIYPFAGQLPPPIFWTPTLDGDFLREDPETQLRAGRVARVPLLQGQNADEGLFLIDQYQPLPNTSAELASTLKARAFPRISDRTLQDLLAAYPGNASAPPLSLPPDYPWCAALADAGLPCSPQYRRLAAINGDITFHSGRRLLARQWARLGLPGYTYLFAADPTAIPVVRFSLGPGFAMHTAELSYSFGLPAGFQTPGDVLPAVKDVPGHVRLSREILQRWIAFTATLDPNNYPGRSGPKWPDYREGAANLVLDASDRAAELRVEPDTYRARGIALMLDRRTEFTNPA